MKRNNQNIILIGMMGCGKTTIAKLLSKRLKRPIVDVDEFLVEKYDMTIPEMFEISEDYFREREHRCCKIIGDWDGFIVSTGGGVIKNPQNIEALKKKGVVIYLDRPVENILEDIDVSTRPLLKEGKQKLYDLYNQRHDLYLKACDYHVFNIHSLNDTVEQIIKLLEK